MTGVDLRAYLKAAAVALSIITANVGPAAAQVFPSRPIKIVIPYPPGSVSELSTRVLAEPMQSRLGQPIIVDPRPGAGSVVAVRYTLSQPPDGYTLHLYTTSQGIKSATINPPFDVRRDLTQISLLFYGYFALAVNAEKVPATSVKDLVAFAKQHPGQLTFSNFGVGSVSHLAGVLFARMAGIEVVHVPFNGPGANVLALASGTSDVTFEGTASLAPQAQKVRLLAVSSSGRSPAAPDLPGMAESGFPDFDVLSIVSLAAPAGLPETVLKILNATVNAALREKPVVDTTKKLGMNMGGSTPEQITQQVKREVDTFSKLIRDAKLDIE